MKINSNQCTVSLLSIEEYEWFKEGIPSVGSGEWWWLRSKGTAGPYSASVIVDNKLTTNTREINEHYISVRPLIIMTERLPNLSIGKCVSVGTHETKFIYLGRYKHSHYYLSVKCIGKYRFDLDSNDWEVSDLRNWLLKWWRKENERAEEIS